METATSAPATSPPSGRFRTIAPSQTIAAIPIRPNKKDGNLIANSVTPNFAVRQVHTYVRGGVTSPLA